MIRFSKQVHRYLPLAILLLAFALRIIAIDKIPAGLSHDEAYNGVTAIQTLEGDWRIFYEINKGIEPLIIYLEAIFFYFFGIGPIQLRLVNIFCGLLTVALIYPLITRLFNRRLALLTMFGVAISFWAIFVSRLTLRAVTLPPLLILTLYFLWDGLNPKATTRPLLSFALSGLFSGISMYTYLSSRFIPLLIVTLLGYHFIRHQRKRFYWLGVTLLFLIWGILFAPLARYYWQNQESFTRRADQVTVLPYLRNGEFEPLIENTLLTLGMFTIQGDETDRYNLDQRPIFDWLNGIFFYLGVGVAISQLRPSSKQAEISLLTLSWLFFMLLPDFITDDSPHFLRTIGAIPVVYLLWAWGLETALHQAEKIIPRYQPRYISPLILILLVLMTLRASYDYFGRWANAPEARYIYGADIAEIATYLKNHPSEDLTVISAEYYRDLDPFRFALHFQGQAPFAIWFDGQQTLAFPPPEMGLTPRYLFPNSAPPAENWSSFLEPVAEESGRSYTLYRLQDKNTLESAWTNTFKNHLTTNINNDLLLLGYRVLGVPSNGGKFQLLLGWQALRTLPPGTDYTFLVRLYDGQSHLWSEADGNGYPPTYWQPGVKALQLFTFRLPSDLPPRLYHLTVEVVDRHLRQSLPATSGETQIPLGTIESHLSNSSHSIDTASLRYLMKFKTNVEIPPRRNHY